MERSYYVPSNKLKGENRILYIFTGKSLIYTFVGALIGIIFYLLLAMIGSKIAGIVVIIVLSLIGYGVGTIKMPTSGNTRIVKNVGGDSIDELIFRYIMYRKNRKVYSYAVPRKEPDYTKLGVSADLIDRINQKINLANDEQKTKEENK